MKDSPKSAGVSQPAEPHLIANLRCYFADFPYLRSSNQPKVSYLGDLLRLLVRSIMIDSFVSESLWFSRFNRPSLYSPNVSENHSLSLTLSLSDLLSGSSSSYAFHALTRKSFFRNVWMLLDKLERKDNFS